MKARHAYRWVVEHHLHGWVSFQNLLELWVALDHALEHLWILQHLLMALKGKGDIRLTKHTAMHTFYLHDWIIHNIHHDFWVAQKMLLHLLHFLCACRQTSTHLLLCFASSLISDCVFYAELASPMAPPNGESCGPRLLLLLHHLAVANASLLFRMDTESDESEGT